MRPVAGYRTEGRSPVRACAGWTIIASGLYFALVLAGGHPAWLTWSLFFPSATGAWAAFSWHLAVRLAKAERQLRFFRLEHLACRWCDFATADPIQMLGHEVNIHGA